VIRAAREAWRRQPRRQRHSAPRGARLVAAGLVLLLVVML
jgi:hypothetical protein